MQQTAGELPPLLCLRRKSREHVRRFPTGRVSVDAGLFCRRRGSCPRCPGGGRRCPRTRRSRFHKLALSPSQSPAGVAAWQVRALDPSVPIDVLRVAGPAFPPCPGDQQARVLPQGRVRGRSGAPRWHRDPAEEARLLGRGLAPSLGLGVLGAWCWRDGLQKLVVRSHGPRARAGTPRGRRGTRPHRRV